MLKLIQQRFLCCLFAAMTVALILPAAAPAQTKAIKERSEVSDKYKWDLSAICKSDQVWEADMKSVEEMIPVLKGFEGTIAQSPDNLLKYYKAFEETNKKLENCLTYAFMSYDQDTRNQKYTGDKDRVSMLGAQLGEATAWFAPEIVAIADATFEKWYKEKPELALYRHSIDEQLRNRLHTLAPGEERLMALTSNMGRAPSSANTALRNTDIKFPSIKDEDGNDVELSEGRVRMLLESPDGRLIW